MNEFIKLLQDTKNNTEYARSMSKYYPNLTNFITIEVQPGAKYDRIVEREGEKNGGHVVYFVEKSTGNIYGAESWKKPNFKRQYGDLSTINEWDWTPYYAISKTGIDSLVPKSQRKK